MMRIFLILMLVTIGLAPKLVAQDSTYYWYKGQKKYLLFEENTEALLLQNEITKEEFELELKNLGPSKIRYLNKRINKNQFSRNQPNQETWAIIDKQFSAKLDIESNSNVLYSSPYLKSKSGEEVGISQLFYVELIKEEDISILRRMAIESNVEIVCQDERMPVWCTLACSKNSLGNSLEISNLFYESGFFKTAEPRFLIDLIPLSTNDYYYGDQWGLENTGQYGGEVGTDININDAWGITSGDKNITVAVIDGGIEANGHEDLTNLSPYSYNVDAGTSPGFYYHEHGMAMSGIISANTNNSLGVAGIAPISPLMTLSKNLNQIQASDLTEIANAMLWADDKGACVFNNSWRTAASVTNSYYDAKVSSLITSGRDGLGCVVVCASGNEESDVAYPANSNPDIIAVGAINQKGKRVSPDSWDGEDWGSNYSTELDIVAPGILIPTIDEAGDDGFNHEDPVHIGWGGTLISSDYSKKQYTRMPGGTSSATAFVSGVAVLVLSANNGLTSSDVVDIIESTAQKVGGYEYEIEPGRANGTWHEEMGYGLVDAGAAVTSAVCDHTIENTTYSSDITISGCSSVEMENILVEDDAILTIEDVGSILISGTFEAEIGTQLVFDP